jgi:hypothetical protein
MKKLKNIYYKKIYDSEIDGLPHQQHYYEIYDLNQVFITSVLLWDSVLHYNKYGYHNE